MIAWIAGRKRSKAGAILLAALCVAGFVAVSEPTAAQEEPTYRPRSLLDMLFRRGTVVREPAVRRPTVKKAKTKKPKSRQAGGEVVRVEEPEAMPKRDDSRVVLVIGDFMADALSEGLVAAYSQNPNIKIVARTNGSSGFVRRDFYDWPAEFKRLAETEKPAAVVVMLGANDRQQMKIGTAREAPLNENWLKEYELRTDALAAAVKQGGVPFVWVGLPAFKSAKVSSDLLTLNDVYRKSTENAGGSFVDIWDGFVDENGAFVMNGPDMNGQPVRLRSSDGISLSKAGKRKVAFYVEKPLNKLLGAETVPAPGLSGGQVAGPAGPANIYVDRTMPIAINDPELDGGQVLLGETRSAKAETRTVAERLVVEGVAMAPAPGRADDFGGAAQPPAIGAAPTAAVLGASTVGIIGPTAAAASAAASLATAPSPMAETAVDR